ncbi:MAG: histidine phosphatase family protein [Actinomycetota bacterium]|nr:histidine phosphatase family protein [Actinomycetota bacterium]
MPAVDPTDTAPPKSVTTTQTVVHLLRHGEVDNPHGILYGRLPGFHLSALGRQVAQAVADDLIGRRHLDLRYLAASSLIRAQETAAPLATAGGLPIVTDDRLIEAANAFEGSKFRASMLRKPQHWAKLRNPTRPSWGEPYLEIAHRMSGALYAAEEAARGGVAVLVSHQLPIWTLRRYLQGQRLWHNPARRQCNLASLTTVHFADGVITSVRYSEPVAQLAAAGTGVGA